MSITKRDGAAQNVSAEEFSMLHADVLLEILENDVLGPDSHKLFVLEHNCETMLGVKTVVAHECNLPLVLRLGNK